ncbi:SAM-dependent methyltransferase [Paraburkholderia elongata]|uniref:S-adenosyl-L-methionine-dependent methyltransferase n=1 Tax=Paraburkholderia elongata TaxID=2675747 RepID=A0A972SJT8_9BURK|nr:SAM-dependent methyltransferase [Paraburkholderia elongata]NPT53850.1 SAM-dependent methyltransferase [Paraburkholderia elongata]
MTEKKFPGVWGGILCRKRYIDEKLIESIGQIEALVNLGAGFDTRAYRLAPIARIPVWEVDQPQNIEAKRRRLRKLFGEIPENVTLVPIDFDQQTPAIVLPTCGYSIGKRTFFIWEGVTQSEGIAGSPEVTTRRVLDGGGRLGPVRSSRFFQCRLSVSMWPARHCDGGPM